MINVFIGTEPAQWLATEVLKSSILAHASCEVMFHELKDLKLNLKREMFTGFSFYRFSIPKACNFEGRAIYLDADMVMLADIRELMEMDMGEHGVLARRRTPDTFHTSNMLMDCEKLTHWDIEEWVALINSGLLDYKEMMVAGPGTVIHDDFGVLPDNWNHLDQFDDSTKLIHYTHIAMQPWKKRGNPNAHVFLRAMKACMDDGKVTEEQVRQEIAAKHIYPEILEDMNALPVH